MNSSHTSITIRHHWIWIFLLHDEVPRVSVLLVACEALGHLHYAVLLLFVHLNLRYVLLGSVWRFFMFWSFWMQVNVIYGAICWDSYLSTFLWIKIQSVCTVETSDESLLSKYPKQLNEPSASYTMKFWSVAMENYEQKVNKSCLLKQ